MKNIFFKVVSFPNEEKSCRKRIKKLRKSVVDLELKISKNKYVIDTAPEDPKLPGLFVFCGSRGSGKTYACVAMAKHFEKLGYITRTF